MVNKMTWFFFFLAIGLAAAGAVVFIKGVNNDFKDGEWLATKVLYCAAFGCVLLVGFFDRWHKRIEARKLDDRLQKTWPMYFNRPNQVCRPTEFAAPTEVQRITERATLIANGHEPLL